MPASRRVRARRHPGFARLLGLAMWPASAPLQAFSGVVLWRQGDSAAAVARPGYFDPRR